MELVQRESAELRRQVNVCMPEKEAADLLSQLSSSQAALLDAQQQIQRLESQNSRADMTAKHFGTERNSLLAKISDLEHYQARNQKQLHQLQQDACVESGDAVKAVLADKNAEIDRLTKSLDRAQADATLRLRSLEQAQVGC
jgi:predicted nuclease with TOPRIM domain